MFILNYYNFPKCYYKIKVGSIEIFVFPRFLLITTTDIHPLLINTKTRISRGEFLSTRSGLASMRRTAPKHFRGRHRKVYLRMQSFMISIQTIPAAVSLKRWEFVRAPSRGALSSRNDKFIPNIVHITTVITIKVPDRFDLGTQEEASHSFSRYTYYSLCRHVLSLKQSALWVILSITLPKRRTHYS